MTVRLSYVVAPRVSSEAGGACDGCAKVPCCSGGRGLGKTLEENPHLGAFAAPRHAITETSAGGREASKRSHWLIFSALSDQLGSMSEESGKSDGLTALSPARRRAARRGDSDVALQRFAAGVRFVQAAARGQPPRAQAVLTPPLRAELASRSLNTA